MAVFLPSALVSPGAAWAAAGTIGYVTNEGDNTVTPIDAASNTAGTPIPVGRYPTGVAITPDGATAYVANEIDGTVTPIDTATHTAGAPIRVGSDPFGVAVTPDGSTVYVTNEGNDTVTPIDAATDTAGTAIPVGRTPIAVAVTPDGRTAYVANTDSNTVTPIDTATNTPGTPIPVGNSPERIAISPNGATAYVTNTGSNTVTPINTATNTAGTPIPVGTLPRGIALTPDGATAYVVNIGGGPIGTVTPINTASNTAGTPTTVGNNPHGVAVGPDGATAYVTNWGDGTVTPIDTATNTTGTPIPVGSGPEQIAFAPIPLDTSIDSHPVDPTNSNGATFTFSANQVRSSFQCELDGGGFSPCTSPQTYTNLGDGSHTFAVRAINGEEIDTTPASFSWTIDTTAPDTQIDSHPDNPTTLTSASFTFHATETATFQCSLDNSTYTACTSPQTYQGLAKGSHTFHVKATDTLGNTDSTPATYNWIIGGPPTVKITAHPAKTTTKHRARFAFTASDPGATFQCSLGRAPWTPCALRVTYTNLRTGRHTFRVKAIDAAGRSKPARYRWTIIRTRRR
jgi:YVTN family beta-propeller protein